MKPLFPLGATRTLLLWLGLMLAAAAPLHCTAATGAAAEPAVAADTPSAFKLVPDVMMLQPSDIDTFLAATRAFHEEGLALERTETGVTATEQGLAVLAEHGLTPATMRQLSYSVTVAYAALTRGPDALEQEIDASSELMAGMADQMSLEQQVQMQEQIEAARQLIESIRNQPEQNLTVVEARQDEIAALLTNIDPRRQRGR